MSREQVLGPQEWLDEIPHGRGLTPSASLRWRNGVLYQWWNATRPFGTGCWIKVQSEDDAMKEDSP